MSSDSIGGTPPDSPDFHVAFAEKLEAKAAELAKLAESVQAATEVEVMNNYARMRVQGARIVAFEFTDAAVSVAKSSLPQHVMSLYEEAQARLATQNANALSGLGIDLMSGMPGNVRERAEELE
ncbi:hypothetical protein [Enemella sp. A6]|uniref:hypothetical protein n=1 Tax=Enemella sp. A6 TaxID=3440152 RepID=UPI003EBC4D9A